MTWDSKFWGINNYLSDLERKGRNLVVIIDPHIKNDEGYQIFAKAKEKSSYIYLNKITLSEQVTCPIFLLENVGVKMLPTLITSIWKLENIGKTKLYIHLSFLIIRIFTFGMI